jgi:hypothetical protein
VKRKISVETLVVIEDWVDGFVRGEEQEHDCRSVYFAAKHYGDDIGLIAGLIDSAQRLPYIEFVDHINRYDSSCPPMDELQFVRDLATRYGVERGDIVQRIQNVRRIKKYRKKG